MSHIKRNAFAAFNMLFFILGLACIGVGIYSNVVYVNWMVILNNSKYLLQAANILIGAGFCVAVVGFLGCYGAWKKNNKCLIAYAALIIFIFILEIAAGAYAYTNQKKVQHQLEKGVFKSIEFSYGSKDPAAKGVTKAVDWFQQKVKCCGSANPADWQKSLWFKGLKKNDTAVPTSCCVYEQKGCNAGKSAKALGNKIYLTGCVEAGMTFAKGCMKHIGAVAIAIGIIELLGILFAFLLYRENTEYHEV